MILYLSEEDVQKCLTVKDTVEAVEDGIRLLGQGKAVQPPKIYMELNKYSSRYSGFVKPMIAFVDEPMHVSATKNFTFFPANRGKGMPTVLATIILNEPETGVPLAIMGGTWITGARTAAATAIAAKYLAKQNSEVAAIFGAGLQGRTHLRALNEVVKLKSVKVADISEEYKTQFAEEMSAELGIDVIPVDSNEQAVRGSDIVITVTTGKDELVRKEWLEPGMFIAKVGSYQEIDFGVLEGVDKLVVDWWEYVSHRVPEIAETNTRREDVYAELAEVVSGTKKGRENDLEKILFIAIGMGVEDVAVALRAYQCAKELNIGQTLEA